MMRKSFVAVALCLLAGPLAAHADSVAPFGVLSAYNIVALGSSSLAGSITENNDVEGRVAAAGSDQCRIKRSLGILCHHQRRQLCRGH
jgi:hypothetical protein